MCSHGNTVLAVVSALTSVRMSSPSAAKSWRFIMPKSVGRRQHEHSVNVALAEVLDGFGYKWNAHAELLGAFSGERRSDILVTSHLAPPVVIEAEVKVDNQAARRAEQEAKSRLGLKVSPSLGGREISTSIALLYPPLSGTSSPQDIREALRVIDLEYALFYIDNDSPVIRFPDTGWITGKALDLASLLHVSRLPVWQIDMLAESFEGAIMNAAGKIANHKSSKTIGAGVANFMNQVNDEQGQSLRMAMTVLMNALIFHDALNEAALVLPGFDRIVKSPDDARTRGVFSPSKLCDEWGEILNINFWPIFNMSKDIVKALPTSLASEILAELWETAEFLISQGATLSHDVTGMVFQRLIADRQFLAAYYTRPAAATLLAGLAIPNSYCDWTNEDVVSKLRIGDFACGTGTLLSTAYQRLLLLHELNGGNPSAIHSRMMMDGLVGLDVLPVAVHLTATMLANMYPAETFDRECIMRMPFGFYKYGPCVGSIELLAADDRNFREALKETSIIPGRKGEIEAYDFSERIGDNFDIVIMNPPFTRSNDDIEGSISPVSAMNFNRKEQVMLNDRLKQLTADGSGHGNAGLASHFTEIGHRKTKQGGRLALVLPMTALTGDTWRDVRRLWRAFYTDMVVIIIAQSRDIDCAFSADTGMADCLFVGTKTTRKFSTSRIHCVVLHKRPSDTVVSSILASEIQNLVSHGTVRNLESGPYGGTALEIGNTRFGEIIECPVPDSDDAWPVAGVRDLSLMQTAYQLQGGKLWIAGMSEGIEVPITTIEKVAKLGYYHLSIIGRSVNKNNVPQGPFDLLEGCSKGDEFPALWNHDARRERSLTIEPWHHLKVRQAKGVTSDTLQQMVDKIMQRASRIHYNCDLRYNSQSTIAQFTKRRTVGGRAWPNVVFTNEEHEYAFSLWCNSTLGLLCHWWMSNKAQSGRGTSSHDTIKSFPTLRLDTLSSEQLSAAKKLFKELETERFLPYNQIDEDEARKRLDKALIVDVLGLPASLCKKDGPMDLLRRKISMEPKIQGNKKTKVLFAEDGETTRGLSDAELSEKYV